MRYVWDATKEVLNRRNHGLSLADAIAVLEDSNCESWVDERFDYEEERIITIGRNKNAILVVVSAVQDPVEGDEQETTRIISVRRATKHETYWYNFGRP